MRDDSPRTVSRRQFTSTAAMAALSAAIVPSRVVGQDAPSSKLDLAAIGIGGMGASNLKACAAENIVALCDVDRAYAAKVIAAYPKAKFYVDYREMLEKETGIDGVIIATPDHTHAAITMAVLRAGKHVSASHLPELFSDQLQMNARNAERGKEKRRHLLAYLRDHPEELRPVSRKLLLTHR